MSTSIGVRGERPRLQVLSDLIFGVALSISALTLVGQQPGSIEELSFSLGLYGFSFLILISVWKLYSSITSVIHTETSLLLNLNIGLLFFVSIEPYLFNELFALRGALYIFVSGMYSIDLSAMVFITSTFEHFVIESQKDVLPKDQISWYKNDRNMNLVIAMVFAASVIPFFGDTTLFISQAGNAIYLITLRNVMWLLGLVIGWSKRLLIGARG